MGLAWDFCGKNIIDNQIVKIKIGRCVGIEWENNKLNQ
jgi:hypothetical protein